MTLPEDVARLTAGAKHILYVENNVGRRFADTFNAFRRDHGCAAVYQAEVHRQMQRRQEGDEWWIREVSRLGWVIVTTDARILRLAIERQTFADEHARAIVLTTANDGAWLSIGRVANHWRRITSEVLERRGPIALRVSTSETRKADLFPPRADG